MGLCGGREEGAVATLSSRGRGETTAVPNWAKLIGVSGSGVSVTVGLAMIGAMIGFLGIEVCVVISPRCSQLSPYREKVRGERERVSGRGFKK